MKPKNPLLPILLITQLTAFSGVRAEDAIPPAPLAPPAISQGISINFQNTDIDLVLKFFSDAAGLVFIKSDSVRGFVTVMAPGRVTIPEAIDVLQSVLELKGFALVPGPGKVMRVLSQAEAMQSSLDVSSGPESVRNAIGSRIMTHIIPLKFISALDAKAELAPLLSKSGNIIADERMNTLVVTDAVSNIQRLLRIVEGLDVRSPQVLIEALIVELSLTNETKMGFEWSTLNAFHSDGHKFNTSASQTFDVPSVITEGLKYSVIREDLRLTGLFQMLATDKNVNILSTPHILTLNNQAAVIRVGEEVPVLTQTRNIQGGETIRSFDYKSVAIELEVTPRINQDREVLLKVHPLVKKILGVNAELNAPILATREAQTSVMVNDGATVVIGGLMKDDRAVSKSKIPILGDIPLIGWFFRQHGVTKEKTELLVFLTPRVLLNPDEARAITIKKESEAREVETPYRRSAREHMDKGLAFYREKNTMMAIQEWEQVINESPDENLREKAKKLIEKARRRRK